VTPARLESALRANQWTIVSRAPFEARDISALWSVSVVGDDVVLTGPRVSGGGRVLPRAAVVDRRPVGPFGWWSTVAAVLESAGFCLDVPVQAPRPKLRRRVVRA
jgi:hypothetical protein